MSISVNLFQVMIASPGDVATEREVVKRVIHEWNSIHALRTKIVLLPAGWDTNSYPQMGDRPQEIINSQVLDKCDLLVGIFWTRIGSPTGVSISGTVEEIERHSEIGKPTMLYFSSKPVSPDSIDSDQYSQVVAFKKKCEADGLYETFESISEFTDKFRVQLNRVIFDNPYFSSGSEIDIAQPRADTRLLKDKALELLVLSSKSTDGTIIKTRTSSGLQIQVDQQGVVQQGNPRSEAEWEDALNTLIQQEYIQDIGHKGEIFRMTQKGYETTDLIR